MGRLQEVAGELVSLAAEQSARNAVLGKAVADVEALTARIDKARQESEGAALMLQGLATETEALASSAEAVGLSAVDFESLAARVTSIELDEVALREKLEQLTRYQSDAGQYAREAHERGALIRSALDEAVAFAREIGQQ